MTCIVGIEAEDKVYLGGDFMGSDGYSKGLVTQSKVFHLTQNIIFGYTTSFRFGQIIEHFVIPPERREEETVYRYLCRRLIPEIKSQLELHGYQDGCGQALVGIDNELWELQSDYSVIRSTKGYNSVGCGDTYAKGYLSQSKKKNPEKSIKKAIKAASMFSTGVSEECIVISNGDLDEQT